MACGLGGSICTPCATGTCNFGVCGGAGGGGGGNPTCGPLSCSGCCAGGVCLPDFAQTSASCGFGGAVCTACPAGQTCQFGKCAPPPCGLGTCNGCCSGGICLAPQFQGPFSCGNSGQMCMACPPGGTCVNGICQAPPPPDAGPPPPVDGGIGSGCLFDGQCQPPSNGLCIPETVFGSHTGWPGGYCSAQCASTPCGPGNSCINAADAQGNPNWLCFKSCPNPRMGQSMCRSGYVCEIDITSPTGTGFCLPRCDSPGFSCWQGTTCSLTGYCVASGPP